MPPEIASEIPSQLPANFPLWGAGILSFFIAIGVISKTDGFKIVQKGILWVFSRRARLLATNTQENVEAVKELSRAMRAVLADSGADRVNVGRIHNGGGRIDDLANPKYINVYDSVDHNVTLDARVSFQKTPMTEAYRNEVLEPMIQAKGQAVSLQVHDFSPDNPLKPFCLVDNITTIVVCTSDPTAENFWSVELQYKEMIPSGSDALVKYAVAIHSAQKAADILARLTPKLI